MLCVCFAGSKYTLETRPQELGIDVRQELLKLHSKHYSSNLMALVVLGRGETLELAVQLFNVSPLDSGLTKELQTAMNTLLLEVVTATNVAVL